MRDRLKFGQVFIWRPGRYDIHVMVVAPVSPFAWKIVNLVDDDRSSLGERAGALSNEAEYVLLDPDIYRPEPD